MQITGGNASCGFPLNKTAKVTIRNEICLCGHYAGFRPAHTEACLAYRDEAHRQQQRDYRARKRAKEKAEWAQFRAESFEEKL